VGESPYRSAYRVEDRDREPNAEERALIEERRARHLAIQKKNELAGPRGVVNMAGLALLVFAIGAAFGEVPLMFGAALCALMFGAFGWIGYQQAMKRIRARPSRWDSAAESWRTHETRIRARSVVYAAGEDEDYSTWLLFEIPGGEWAAIDDLWVPPERHGDLPNSDLVLTWLEPANECIGVETHGGPLPRHGAVRLSEPDYEGAHFAQAIAAGFGWGDPDDEDDAYEPGHPVGTGPIRRVPEGDLPPWMRAAVRES